MSAAGTWEPAGVQGAVPGMWALRLMKIFIIEDVSNTFVYKTFFKHTCRKIFLPNYQHSFQNLIKNTCKKQ
jgi:hypothetical protein